METRRSLYLELMQARLRAIASGFWGRGFVPLQSRPPWHPAVNVYRWRERMVVCVDLAGVAQNNLELRVEPHRVWLAGHRTPLAAATSAGESPQVIALEIEDGRFEREILLHAEVDASRAGASQRDGMLWIEAPLVLPASDSPPS